MSISIIIIVVTVLVSLAAFNNNKLMNDLLLWPAKMNSPAQYYRLLTSGFVHADYMHLGFNMFSFYFFADLLETNQYGIGVERFLILYLSAIVVASMPSYLKKRKNPGYRSLGASGGVAAIIFATIYLYPWQSIYIFFAIPLPSIVFAVLYLVYSAYAARKGSGGINHDAHFWGAVYGILFMLVIDPSHGMSFIQQLSHPQF